MTEPFDIRTELMEQINATDDKQLRTLFMLMLGVLDHSIALGRNIDAKLDKLLTDEATLQKSVLNGFAGEPHHKHHTYIAGEITKQAEIERLRKWAADKIKDEEEDAQAATEAKRAAWNSTVATVTETLVKGVLYVGLMMAGLRFAGPMVLGG